MKKILCAILTIFSVRATAAAGSVTASERNPKREFRGAWLHVIEPMAGQEHGAGQGIYPRPVRQTCRNRVQYRYLSGAPHSRRRL